MSNYKNGKTFDSRGYVYILCPGHPKVINKNKKYVAEHVLMAEKKIGRLLFDGEVVHHINGIKNDNRLENLMVCENQSAHRGEHKKYVRFIEYPEPKTVGEIIVIKKHKFKRYETRSCIRCEKLFWFDLENNKKGCCSKSCGQLVRRGKLCP